MPNKRKTDRGSLTCAQRTVCGLVLEGLTESEIAERLRRSFHTIHAHMRNIHATLGVRNRTMLVTELLREKFEETSKKEQRKSKK